MTYTDWNSWNKADLVEYLDFLLHSYRVVDAFWFLNVENRHGHDEACQINELVWGKSAQLAARDLKKRFNLNSGGLKDFVKGLEIFPWHLIVGYQIDHQPDQVIVTVPSCPAQMGRLEHGLGEYDCKAMHRAEFESFAKVIDPAIRVHCDFAPPDDHPKDIFCRWRFTLTDK